MWCQEKREGVVGNVKGVELGGRGGGGRGEGRGGEVENKKGKMVATQQVHETPCCVVNRYIETTTKPLLLCGKSCVGAAELYSVVVVVTQRFVFCATSVLFSHLL